MRTHRISTIHNACALLAVPTSVFRCQPLKPLSGPRWTGGIRRVPLELIGQQDVTLENVYVLNNSGYTAAAVLDYSVSATFTNCEFSNSEYLCTLLAALIQIS